MSEDTGTTEGTTGSTTDDQGTLAQGDVPLAVEVAAEVQAFLDTVTHVAAGDGECSAVAERDGCRGCDA